MLSRSGMALFGEIDLGMPANMVHQVMFKNYDRYHASG